MRLDTSLQRMKWRRSEGAIRDADTRGNDILLTLVVVTRCNITQTTRSTRSNKTVTDSFFRILNKVFLQNKQCLEAIATINFAFPVCNVWTYQWLGLIFIIKIAYLVGNFANLITNSIWKVKSGCRCWNAAFNHRKLW